MGWFGGIRHFLKIFLREVFMKKWAKLPKAVERCFGRGRCKKFFGRLGRIGLIPMKLVLILGLGYVSVGLAALKFG